jgi:hypothetical protein
MNSVKYVRKVIGVGLVAVTDTAPPLPLHALHALPEEVRCKVKADYVTAVGKGQALSGLVAICTCKGGAALGPNQTHS